MAAAEASNFSAPVPSGAFAVNTSPQALQRSRSRSITLAWRGDRPTILTITAGSAMG